MSKLVKESSRTGYFRRPVGASEVGWVAAVGVLALIAAPTLSVGSADAADCKSMAASSIDWQGCSKNSLVLQSSTLDGANLSEADLSFTDLRGSTLTGANVEKAALFRSSLAGSTADKANFARVEGYRTSFAEVSAQGASFSNAELQRADFTKANLTGADFSKAELGRAVFTDAIITGATFKLANLARAGINEAKFDGPIDVTGAFFLLTRIEGMDLNQLSGLAQWQIDQACGDGATKLPQGLTPAAHWPCEHD